MIVSSLAYLSTLKIEATCLSETSLDFEGLHGVISQDIEISKYIFPTIWELTLNHRHKFHLRLLLLIEIRIKTNTARKNQEIAEYPLKRRSFRINFTGLVLQKQLHYT
jgi:hypothetical protein